MELGQENELLKNPKALPLLILWFAVSLVIVNACDDDEKDPIDSEDASVDASDDSGTADGFTCMECHLDKDLLLADLEADPLPEPEDPEPDGGSG